MRKKKITTFDLYINGNRVEIDVYLCGQDRSREYFYVSDKRYGLECNSTDIEALRKMVRERIEETSKLVCKTFIVISISGSATGDEFDGFKMVVEYYAEGSDPSGKKSHKEILQMDIGPEGEYVPVSAPSHWSNGSIEDNFKRYHTTSWTILPWAREDVNAIKVFRERLDELTVAIRDRFGKDKVKAFLRSMPMVKMLTGSSEKTV